MVGQGDFAGAWLGAAADQRAWESEFGAQGWSYDDVLPYFKRMETTLAGADEPEMFDAPALPQGLEVRGVGGHGGVDLGAEALEQVPDPGADPETAMGARDVLAGLDALPEEQRSVLLLVAVEDLSYAEAAKVLGVPLGTVMSRLSRARTRMRGFLETGRTGLLRRVK